MVYSRVCKFVLRVAVRVGSGEQISRHEFTLPGHMRLAYLLDGGR